MSTKLPPFTEWHGNGIRAKVRIPEELRFLFPVETQGHRTAKTKWKRFLYRNLETSDPAVADLAAREFVAAARKLFNRLGRKGIDHKMLRAEAYRWSKAIKADPNSCKPPLTEQSNLPPISPEELEELLEQAVFSEFDALVDRAYDLEQQSGHARTLHFFNLASGRCRPIRTEGEEWLKSPKYSPATRNKYRKLIEVLITWCNTNRIRPLIEEMDSRRVHRFLSRRTALVRNEKAKANEKAALGSLWRWSNAKLKTNIESKFEGREHWIGDTGNNPWTK